MKIKNGIRKISEYASGFWGILKYCFWMAWSSSPFYTVGRLLSKLVLPLTGIANSFIAKAITNLLLQPSAMQLKWQLLLFVVFLLISNIISSLCNQLITYFTKMHEDILNKDIDIKIMKKSLMADLEMYDNPDYYNKLSIAERDAMSLSAILWSTIDFFSQLISVIISFFVLCYSNVFYGIFLLLGTIPAAISTRSYTKAIYGLSVSQMTSERKKRYYSYVSSDREFAQTVRLYNLKDFFVSRYLKLWDSLYWVRKRLIKGKTILISLLQFIPELLIIGITIHILFNIVDGKLSVGDYVLLTGLLAQLYQGIMGAVTNAMAIYDSKLKIETIQSFGNMPQHIYNSGADNIDEIHSIEFQNVSFRYPKSSQNILKNICFKISEDEKIALVGLNGSGKSTIIKLILRFYDATEGQILINGRNIKEFNINSLRQCFDAYFQNSFNFAFSIRDNLILNTQEEADDKRLISAIRYAKADDILKTANHGLDTYLTKMFDDDGIEVSGGQHQKIALSRVFFNDRKFLLLDEPSSSLDPEAENTFFQSIEKLCMRKTILFTSHRFTNLYLADKIIVLENGEIIEEGTKDSLLNHHGRFFHLYNLQAQKFKID